MMLIFRFLDEKSLHLWGAIAKVQRTFLERQSSARNLSQRRKFWRWPEFAQVIAQAAAFPIPGRSAFVLGHRPAYLTMDSRFWRGAGGQTSF